ncbi:MAG: COX15/CtaA family protein [Candidatus Eiseniibacteriota bacterium]
MNRASRHAAAALVTGFGTSLAMWVLGFALRMPPAATPGWLVLALLLVVLAAGGAFAGGGTGAGARAGAAAGLVASLVNLLVLGSLLGGEEPNRLVPVAALWIPGSLVCGAACGALGALAVGRGPAPAVPPDWTAVFARIGALATLALVMLGGLVTSHEAGLAVVDWPNSYGYNMFLYPLSRMVGGIWYEHAHRLFGSLVGLTTLALFFRLLACEPRRSVKAWGAAAVVLVIAQGILGGLRVTGHFTTAATPDAVRPSLALAMVHGVAGQLFFAWMVCLAALTSRTWKERTGAVVTDAAGTDRTVSWIVIGALLIQLLLGVRVRHTGEGVMLHITFAVVVLAVIVLAGVRTLGNYSGVVALRKSAGALLGHGVTQLVLGGFAFFLVNLRSGEGTPPASEVWVTTLHQTVGALLLGNAAILAAWSRRLLTTGDAGAAAS